jgi:hypothetical protein
MPKFDVSPEIFYQQVNRYPCLPPVHCVSPFRHSARLSGGGGCSDAVYAHVDADVHKAIYSQVYETPTFVVNGFKAQQLSDTTTFPQWTAFIDSLLNSTTLASKI